MYLRDLIRLPSSAISLRPLRSLDRHDLFARERGLLWLRHEPLQSLALRFGTNSFLIRDPLYQLVSQVPLFVLSRLLSSLWVSRTGSASDWCALEEALYKCIDNTIQYNTIQYNIFCSILASYSKAQSIGLTHQLSEAELSQCNDPLENPGRSPIGGKTINQTTLG